MSKIAAIGMFDGVHLGHRHLWRQISQLRHSLGPDASTLAVTFRNHPLELIAPQRAPQRLCPVEERMDMLRGAGADEILLLDFTPRLRSLTAAEFASMLMAEHSVTDLVAGFNNSIGSDRVRTPQAYGRLAADTGLRLHPAGELRLDGLETICSSAIRRALAEGDIYTANRMLGRPYSIRGITGHGRQLGRTIGFPTANVEASDLRQLIPAPGVYALDVTLPDGTIRRAMANIGHRPTVERQACADLSMEVNIFDFEGDLYGRPLTLHFLKRLRSERRFDSLQQLADQLQADRRMAKAL